MDRLLMNGRSILIPAKKPSNEEQRLQLLTELDILDTLEEQNYDDLTFLASDICASPISLVSLVDKDRQWFKSHHGIDARETPRDLAFCAHAILQDDVFCIEDSEKDERFHNNPLVLNEPNVRFYAGVPLTVRKDYKVGTLCVIDHSAKKLSKRQLNSLVALARQVEAQLELRLRLKESEILDKIKSEFFAMASHELRTPLTSIYGALCYLSKDNIKNDVTKRDKLLATALNNSERLTGLVNDVLDSTKLELAQVDLVKEELNLNDVAVNTVDSLEQYFEKCHVHVHLDLDKELPKSLFDEKRISQIIINFLSNAAKFSPDGSSITVSTSHDGNMITLNVIDEGPGIPEKSRHELFKKFSRIGTMSKKNLPGSGLGLSISKEIISLHFGSIGCESTEGKGARFYFMLPIETKGETKGETKSEAKGI